GPSVKDAPAGVVPNQRRPDRDAGRRLRARHPRISDGAAGLHRRQPAHHAALRAACRQAWRFRPLHHRDRHSDRQRHHAARHALYDRAPFEFDRHAAGALRLRGDRQQCTRLRPRLRFHRAGQGCRHRTDRRAGRRHPIDRARRDQARRHRRDRCRRHRRRAALRRQKPQHAGDHAQGARHKLAGHAGLLGGRALSMIFQQLINGLMLGASYALVAIGYTLIFGVLRLLYFAHGEVFMVGAFVGLYLVVLGHANIYLALVGAMLACGLLGIVAVYVSVRPVPKDRPLAPLISTIGLTIILQNLAIYIFGGQQMAFPETIRQELYHLGPVTISSVQIFILGTAVTLMLALWLFIERSKTGRAIRATAENPETAALLGVDVNRVVLITFVIGSGIAGVAGVLDGIKNSEVSPFMGLGAAVKGLIVMLLGGLGNVPGAMVAGLMLGMIEILSAAYIGTTERDFFSFLILILILLYKPTGLFGTRTIE